MADNSKNSEMLKSQRDEYVKQHIEYDVDGRVIKVYTAYTDAGHGKRCSLVRYAYIPASAKVSYMKEENSTWDSAWEVALP